MELFGPNSWLSTMYVAALKAGSRWRAALGEAEFGDECARLAKKVSRFLNDKLFNGEYFYPADRRE